MPPHALTTFVGALAICADHDKGGLAGPDIPNRKD